MQLKKHGLTPSAAKRVWNVTAMPHSQRVEMVYARACMEAVLDRVFSQIQITVDDKVQDPVDFLYVPILANLIAAMQVYWRATHGAPLSDDDSSSDATDMGSWSSASESDNATRDPGRDSNTPDQLTWDKYINTFKNDLPGVKERLKAIQAQPEEVDDIVFQPTEFEIHQVETPVHRERILPPLL